MAKIYKVYIHIFPNNKRYIGITSQKVENRWRNGFGYNNQKVMKRAIKKYKWENIEHKVLFDKLTKNEAEQKEIELIKLYKSNNKRYGYNLDNGGSSAGKMSQSSKEKMITSLKKYYQNHPPNIPSIEARKKLSLIHMGELNHMFGKKLTEEERKIRSEATKKAKTKKSINVAMCDMNDNIIKVFSGVNEASRQTGANATKISKCCNQKRNKTFGYKWHFIKDEKFYLKQK